MMEEVSDDTNGESSFEFISGKIEDNNSLKDSSTPPPTSNVLPSTSALTQNPVTPSASSSAAGYVTTLPAIPFYDPRNVASPQSFNQPAIPIPQSEGIPVAPILYSALKLPQDMSLVAPAEKQPDGAGVWGWLKGKEFLNKVAEKAKNSVDSVITTLDPGMKEIINSGGDVHAVVASACDDEVSAVREAFQLVFGKATVEGVAVRLESIAPQPVGFSAGLKAAEERVRHLRQMGFAGEHVVLVAPQDFLAEFTPDNWFDLGCLHLHDQGSGVSLQVYTGAVPVPPECVTEARSRTPPDYPLGWSGYAMTVGEALGARLGVEPARWHEALTGVPRRERLLVAAKTAAGLYRARLGR